MTTMNKQVSHATGRALGLIGTMLLVILAVSGIAVGQSEDLDNPTPVTSNIVSGEGDGKATTYYYSFMAGPGDVKLTVDGKTDKYSSPLRVKLSDEDGKDLLDVYVVANNPSKREVGQRRFVRSQKVIMSVSMNDDAQVKLLSFKIKLDGAVALETAPVADASTAASANTSVAGTPVTEATPSSSAEAPVAAPSASAASSNKALGLSILNAVGERLNLPADGKLRIEMKDGTVQEFDLMKVKKILVKQ
jgi:hypothetical protein